jgi:hypothetical protein
VSSNDIICLRAARQSRLVERTHSGPWPSRLAGLNSEPRRAGGLVAKLLQTWTLPWMNGLIVGSGFRGGFDRSAFGIERLPRTHWWACRCRYRQGWGRSDRLEGARYHDCRYRALTAPWLSARPCAGARDLMDLFAVYPACRWRQGLFQRRAQPQTAGTGHYLSPWMLQRYLRGRLDGREALPRQAVLGDPVQSHRHRCKPVIAKNA